MMTSITPEKAIMMAARMNWLQRPYKLIQRQQLVTTQNMTINRITKREFLPKPIKLLRQIIQKPKPLPNLMVPPIPLQKHITILNMPAESGDSMEVTPILATTMDIIPAVMIAAKQVSTLGLVIQIAGAGL